MPPSPLLNQAPAEYSPVPPPVRPSFAQPPLLNQAPAEYSPVPPPVRPSFAQPPSTLFPNGYNRDWEGFSDWR